MQFPCWSVLLNASSYDFVEIFFPIRCLVQWLSLLALLQDFMGTHSKPGSKTEWQGIEWETTSSTECSQRSEGLAFGGLLHVSTEEDGGKGHPFMPISGLGPRGEGHFCCFVMAQGQQRGHYLKYEFSWGKASVSKGVLGFKRQTENWNSMEYLTPALKFSH